MSPDGGERHYDRIGDEASVGVTRRRCDRDPDVAALRHRRRRRDRQFRRVVVLDGHRESVARAPGVEGDGLVQSVAGQLDVECLNVFQRVVVDDADPEVAGLRQGGEVQGTVGIRLDIVVARGRRYRHVAESNADGERDVLVQQRAECDLAVGLAHRGAACAPRIRDVRCGGVVDGDSGLRRAAELVAAVGAQAELQGRVLAHQVVDIDGGHRHRRRGLAGGEGDGLRPQVRRRHMRAVRHGIGFLEREAVGDAQPPGRRRRAQRQRELGVIAFIDLSARRHRHRHRLRRPGHRERQGAKAEQRRRGAQGAGGTTKRRGRASPRPAQPNHCALARMYDARRWTRRGHASRRRVLQAVCAERVRARSCVGKARQLRLGPRSGTTTCAPGQIAWPRPSASLRLCVDRVGAHPSPTSHFDSR